MDAATRNEEQPLRRVINNHDGGAAELVRPAPPDWGRLVRECIDVMADSHVDALFWGLGSGHTFQHDTRVGEFRGGNRDTFDSVQFWRVRENSKALIREGHDILAGVVEEGHRIGLEVFASLRMNDIHDSHYPERLSRLKTEHPEYLLGDSLEVYERGRAWKFSPQTAFNYAIPEVRAYKLAVIQETLDRYDVDGLELDWTRHGWAFRPGEELENLGVMTEFTRQVRAHVDNASARRGRRLFLALSVPADLEDCRQIGLDVQTWLQDGLIDILVAAGTAFPPDLRPVRAAARAAGCQLFARLIKNPILARSPQVLRAAVAAWYYEGVDGICLFNYYANPHEALIDEIGEPEAIARGNKHYVVSQRSDPFPPYLHTVARPTAAGEPLPINLALSSSGRGQVVPFAVADDLASAAQEQTPPDIRLTVQLLNLCAEEDQLTFRLNGEPLPGPRAAEDGGVDCWLEFELPEGGAPVKQGENRLEVVLEKRNPAITGSLVLSDVELTVTYAGRPASR